MRRGPALRGRRPQRRRRQPRRPAVRQGLRVAAEITTDAKVIPTLVARRLAEGEGLEEPSGAPSPASRARSPSAAQSPPTPTGCCSPCGAAARPSTSGWPRTATSWPASPTAWSRRPRPTSGWTARPPAARSSSSTPAGRHHRGDRLFAYDGTPCRSTPASVQAEVTTRDIDRGDYPHFLLKEIPSRPVVPQEPAGQDAASGRDGCRCTWATGPCPPVTASGLADGNRRVVAIGQGTAAVAAQAVAAVVERALAPTRRPGQRAPATELSGFALRNDMTDTLVIAISQSGTTTDTNRTVDLVRARGATVVGIVNRRNSESSTSPTASSTRRTVGTWRWPCPPPRRSTPRWRRA